MKDSSAEILVQFFFAFSLGGHFEQFWNRQRRPRFDIVHPAFPLPIMTASDLPDALKNGFGEAVMMCSVPKQSEFPCLDCCQKKFLWTHREVDLALHQSLVLVLPVALGLESPDPFLKVSKQGPCLAVLEEDGGDKRLVQLELACLSDVALPDPV